MRAILPLLLCLLLITACGTPPQLAQTPPDDTSAAMGTTTEATQTPLQPASSPAATASPVDPPTVTPAPAATASALSMPTADGLTPTPPHPGANEAIAQQAEAVIRQQADQVVAAIKQRDMQQLATFVHPEKGLRFSLYGHPQQDDLVFSSEQVALLHTDTMTYTWGAHDGSGFPIEMTPAAYFDRFVYSHDFASAEQVNYNQTIDRGNSPDNSRRFYSPNAMIVEYHVPGVNPKYEGMDWGSLRVVFEQLDERWYLVGIMHAEWTI